MGAPEEPASAAPRSSHVLAFPFPRWGMRRAAAFALRQRMYTPEYWRSFLRYLGVRLRRPHVELGGMVHFGRRVELVAGPDAGRLQIAPWCWIGNGSALRSHEGNLRIGPKTVIGADTRIACHLDIEIGAECLVSDGVYVVDFDHRHDRVDLPIRSQGIRATPVRIGHDVWVGRNAAILRGADIGTGSVIASHAVVKDVIPPFSVVAGVPGRVVRSRLPEGMTPEEAVELRRCGHPLPKGARR